MNLIEQNQTFWIEIKSPSNPVLILNNIFLSITIVLAEIERIIRGETHPSFSGEETMPNPSNFCHLRDFEIGEAVL
jgi:hypothetical protein